MSAGPDADYAELEHVLRERSGLVFSALRRASLEAAAARVIRRIGIASQTSLVNLIRNDGAVFDELKVEITVGETYFFREPAHFELVAFANSAGVSQSRRPRRATNSSVGAPRARPVRRRIRSRLC